MCRSPWGHKESDMTELKAFNIQIHMVQLRHHRGGGKLYAVFN